MADLYTLEEILSYVEIKRLKNDVLVPPFVDGLDPCILNEVLTILSDDTSSCALEDAIDVLRSNDKAVQVVRPGGPLNRYTATTLSEILGRTGAGLLLTGTDDLGGLRVNLVNSRHDLADPLMNKKKFRVSIAGLGDVGGTLLMGLRLLGKDVIEEVRIYDRDPKKLRRYYLEVNEISDGTPMSPIVETDLDGVFDSDVFIFTVSLFVPPLDTELRDVRLVQFEKNRTVLLDYALKAEAAGFKGHFFVVSDPVDLLCMSLMLEGNVPPERIRGFGLGVMEARARFIAWEKGYPNDTLRAFGPHGKGLVVVNSLMDYDEDRSKELTQLTEVENFRIRETGFKPYIAPALSSGAISIVKALRGEEHLSTWYNGKVFLGSRNTLKDGFTFPEKVALPEILPELQRTEEYLLELMRKSLEAE